MLWTILLFITLLSLLVFVHELGHFCAARRLGMKVEEFGFGFPPRLFGIQRKHDSTIYSLNWIPIGGFVRIKGEGGEGRGEDDSFASKAAWKRLIVLVAGVAMNVVLAAVLFVIGFAGGIPSVIEDGLPASARVREEKIQVYSVLSQSPAQRAGLEIGDVLVSIDGEAFFSSEQARAYMQTQGDVGVLMEWKKGNGEIKTATIMAEDLVEMDFHGLGVGLVKTGLVSYPFPAAVVQGITTTAVLGWEIMKAFGQIIKDAVLHQKIEAELSGPVGIAVMTGEVAQMGWTYLVHFAAVLSLNLAVINILPFPALDGGHVVFLAAEKIFRRPIKDSIRNLINNAGFAFLMILAVLVTYRDVIHFDY
jgi:regulator of sigma E protease